MSNRALVVAGTRPEIIKLSPVLKCLQKLNVNVKFVWSGQHYDYALGEVFFKELELDKPDVDLDVRSGSHSFQTGKLMISLEKVMNQFRPSIVLAEGDTNTVMATALTAIKSHVPFGHVEAGLRSYDRRMPEEINRIVADSCSELLFAPTELAVTNLTHEGIPLRKIRLTGNTIVDVVNEYREIADRKGKRFLKKLGVTPSSYLLLTLHRQENTDVLSNLSKIVKSVLALAEEYLIIFPIHPRTMIKLQQIGVLEALKKKRNLLLTPSLGYFEFLGLLSHSLTVLTDSGGVQEEAFIVGTPAVTLRYNTERPETVLYGMNVLAGTEPKSIIELTNSQVTKSSSMRTKPATKPSPFGDGNAGRSIAKEVKNAMNDGIRVESANTRSDPYIIHMLVDPKCLKKKWKKKQSAFEVITAYDPDGYPSLMGHYPAIHEKPDKALIQIPLSMAKCLLRGSDRGLGETRTPVVRNHGLARCRHIWKN